MSAASRCGALAITFAAIVVILLAPRADEAYTFAMKFMVGAGLAAVFAAIFAFAVLPRIETFEGFIAVMGLYLVPVGALMSQPWQTAIFIPMVANFVPLLAPGKPVSYDTGNEVHRDRLVWGICGADLNYDDRGLVRDHRVPVDCCPFWITALRVASGFVFAVYMTVLSTMVLIAAR